LSQSEMKEFISKSDGEVFKLSTWNGGCNGLCWSSWNLPSARPNKWCLDNHGLVAYGFSHSYGTSWKKIVDSY
jgi:hypothetical protein